MSEHRPNGCCDYHRYVADGCCHCEQFRSTTATLEAEREHFAQVARETRIKAEALREAADEMVGRGGTSPAAHFLRARAEWIERETGK